MTPTQMTSTKMTATVMSPTQMTATQMTATKMTETHNFIYTYIYVNIYVYLVFFLTSESFCSCFTMAYHNQILPRYCDDCVSHIIDSYDAGIYIPLCKCSPCVHMEFNFMAFIIVHVVPRNYIHLVKYHHQSCDVPTPAKFLLPPKVAGVLQKQFLALSRFMLCLEGRGF